jgi:hypothetical protein
MRTYLLGSNTAGGTIDLFEGQEKDGALRTTRWIADGREASSVFARLICTRPAGCSNRPDDPLAYFDISDMQMTARDSAFPLPSLRGQLWNLGNSNTWVGGERGFTLTAVDFGSGVDRAYLEVNGYEVPIATPPCDGDRGGYSVSFAPCELRTFTEGEVDTTTAPFRDGANSFRACVADFAIPRGDANQTCDTPKTLLVDNQPSAQPVGLEAVGGSNWRAVNRFEFTWQTPSGQTSPIVAAEYRVIAADGDVEVAQGRLDRAEPTSLGPLSVPASGTYRVEVRLVDAAGNVGAPASVPIRFDDAPPGDVAPEAPDGWVSADELPFEQPIEQALPGGPSGVDGYAVAIARDAPLRPCGGEVCSVAELDLSGGPENRFAVIPNLAEGSHWISAVAASGARIPSRQTGSTQVKVDKTEPVTSISGVPDRWMNRPVTVTVAASDDLSGMEPRPAIDDGLPVTSIAVDGQAPYESVGPQVRFTVASEGATQVTFWARDLAGNLNDGKLGPSGDRHRPPGSAVVRIDTVAPNLAFLPRDPEDPELVTASVTDSSSGLDSGSISIRRIGSTTYVPLRTTVGRDQLQARIPSDDLTPGTYELRAQAEDRAGNTGTTSSDASGGAMVLSLPLKRQVRVSLSRVGDSIADGKVRLASGVGLSGASLLAEQRFAPGSRRRVIRVSLRADGTGSFRFRLRPGPTRSVQVSYAGSRQNSRAGSRRLAFAFRDRTSFTLAPTRLRNGGRVTMTGAVRGKGAIQPAAGKLVAIQYFDPGRSIWRPVEVIRTGRSGRFRYSYRFRTIAYAQRILFRATSLSEAGWPYLPSTSTPKSVIVYPAVRPSTG